MCFPLDGDRNLVKQKTRLWFVLWPDEPKAAMAIKRTTGVFFVLDFGIIRVTQVLITGT